MDIARCILSVTSSQPTDACSRISAQLSSTARRRYDLIVMESESERPDFAVAAPLFPLPNVVLFPRAVMALHIFEPRYQAMMAHALEHDNRIAMALLLPGWERDYYGRPPIDPIVCVGAILNHEQLADGKYNLLLQGRVRARVVGERAGYPFRIAQLAPTDESIPEESDLITERSRLREIFRHGQWKNTEIARHLDKCLGGTISTADAADLIAFNLLDDIPLKQSLLAESDVRRRIHRIIAAVSEIHLSPPKRTDWPPKLHPN